MNRLAACIITLNEEKNLPRAIASLAGVADEVVVVDSGSSDRTCEVALGLGAKVFHRTWTNYSEQKNFAADQAGCEWVLSIDADEELNPELRNALLAWRQVEPLHAAYRMARRAYYLGGWVRHSGWYPDRQTRLYRRDRARFGGIVHESVAVDGRVGELQGDLLHYPADTLSDNLLKQDVYTTLAAKQLYEANRRSWRLAALLAPPWTFFQKFVLNAGFLDGYRGWVIARGAARYVRLKYRKLGILVSRSLHSA